MSPVMLPTAVAILPSWRRFVRRRCESRPTRCGRCLFLAAVYPADSMRWAFGMAMRYRALTPGFIASLLASVALETVAPAAEPNGRIEVPCIQVYRDLRDYDRAVQAEAGDAR